MKLLAALLFFGLTTFAQVRIYRENYGWKGPVRSVVGERTDFKILDDGTEIVERKWRQSVINFDEKGALLEQTWYEPSGNV